MAAGSSGLQRLSTEGVNKIHFSSSPSEYLILFHPVGLSHMHIPEPITTTRVTLELKGRINFKQSTWLKMEGKMTYPKNNQNALGRKSRRELTLKS